MNMKKLKALALVLVAALFLGACNQTTQQRVLDSEESQVELRNMQTRAFDTTDRDKTLRTVIATLQDLDFVLDKADNVLGIVTGTKLSGFSVIKMTVSVRPRGEEQLLVRANAQYNITPINDPVPYQQFFAALGKAMFLEAHSVN